MLQSDCLFAERSAASGLDWPGGKERSRHGGDGQTCHQYFTQQLCSPCLVIPVGGVIRPGDDYAIVGLLRLAHLGNTEP